MIAGTMMPPSISGPRYIFFNHTFALCRLKVAFIRLPGDFKMESLLQSERLHSQNGSECTRRIERGERISTNYAERNDDLTLRGQAALDLVDRVADALSARENRLETTLVQTLQQLKIAEDRKNVLNARSVEAERRASEAVKWLRRLHDEIEANLAWRNEHQHRAG